MALVRTTLSSAVSTTDKSIVVASATGFSAGYRIEIDSEVLAVDKSYVSGTTIPVLRGQDGSVTAAHVASAGVVCGINSDYPANTPQTNILKPFVRARTLVSITATQTVTPPVDGSDLVVILNGTAAITPTFAAPTKDMDGCELSVLSTGVAQHVLTFTSGLSGAGSSYDVITTNATAPAAYKFVACNEKWFCYAQIPIAGTVSNVTGTIS